MKKIFGLHLEEQLCWLDILNAEDYANGKENRPIYDSDLSYQKSPTLLRETKILRLIALL